jgi:hypothetical protein
MEALPVKRRQWLTVGLFVAKVYVVLAACLAWGDTIRLLPHAVQATVLILYAAAAVFLLLSGVVQLFTPDRPRAPLNILGGLFALLVILVLLATLAHDTMPGKRTPNKRSALDARTPLCFHMERHWPGASESERWAAQSG